MKNDSNETPYESEILRLLFDDAESEREVYIQKITARITEHFKLMNIFLARVKADLLQIEEDDFTVQQKLKEISHKLHSTHFLKLDECLSSLKVFLMEQFDDSLEVQMEQLFKEESSQSEFIRRQKLAFVRELHGNQAIDNKDLKGSNQR